jgi:prepilin-type N-terminal cleavage/methylation domain-containing protein
MEASGTSGRSPMRRTLGTREPEGPYPRGVTLIELVVALAILGTTLAIAGLGIASLEAPASSRLTSDLALARRRAAESGAPVTVTVAGKAVRFAPDGSAAGGPLVVESLVIVIEPLTGAVHVRAP